MIAQLTFVSYTVNADCNVLCFYICQYFWCWLPACCMPEQCCRLLRITL